MVNTTTDELVVQATTTASSDETWILSDNQERTLAFLNIATALLSTTGSSLIFYHILRNYLSWHGDGSENTSTTSRRRRRREQDNEHHRLSPYERIVLALSASDILFSLSFIGGVFLTPADTSPRVYAIGNDQTCAFLGVMSQLGTSTILYNGMLSTYYFCTVRLGMKREVFERRIERWMHAGIVSFAVVTASVGLVLRKYEEIGESIPSFIPMQTRGFAI